MLIKPAENKSEPTRVLLHCHLFKNAGTTIDWALKRTFKSGFVDHRDDISMHKGGMHYLHDYLASNKRVMAISSHHMPFHPEAESTDRHFFYIVMLRHPIVRAASVYHYEKIQPPDSLGAKMAKQLDMRGYFEWRMRDDVPTSIRDFHTRYLCDIRNPGRRLLEINFDTAVQRAGLPNVFIGFLERFDESMVLFESGLRRDFQNLDFSYIKQNQNQKHTSSEAAIGYLRESLGEHLFATLQQENSSDLRLYELLQKQFEARLSSIEDFSARLKQFKMRCAELH